MSVVKPLTLTNAGQMTVVNPAGGTGDFIGVPDGGTGGSTPPAARAALGIVIGADVQPYSPDATSLHSFNTVVGLPVRVGIDTFAMRNMAVASTARLTVSNPAGTLGDFTYDLALLADIPGGAFLKFTRDVWGRVSGTAPVVAGDITGLVDTVYAPINSPTFTGTVTLPTQTPSSALEAASKAYVDAMVAGQRVRDAVRVASTVNGALATSYFAGQSVDGVVLVIGDRLLLKNQTLGSENGVYVVPASGAPTRATDFDGNSSTGEVVGGATFWVNEGLTQQDTGWTLTNDGAVTVGTTPLTFTQSSGLGQVNASAPLSKVGNTIGAVLSPRVVNTAGAFDLASGLVAPSSYTKVTVDTYGRVVAGATATPAEVGAQPIDPGLSSIAGLTGTGLLVASAVDTYVFRNLATGSPSRITVNNPDGVAGNPTVDLPAGVNTSGPGTYTSVTVDTYGRVTAATVGSGGAAGTYVGDAFVNGNALTISICQVVYATATTDRVDLANANSALSAQAIGLVAAPSIAALASGLIAVAGVFAATTGQWDLVTGQTGGLTPGALYYASNITAGSITTTVPTTGFIAPIGRAMSTTKMALRFDPTVQL